MNRTQRIARLTLIIAGVGIPVSLVTIAISWIVGLFILACVSLIMGLSPLFIRKKPGRIAYDERDMAIRKTAHMIGYCILWCVFIVVCMITGTVAGPAILAATLVAVKLVESAAVLVQYGWTRRGEES